MLILKATTDTIKVAMTGAPAVTQPSFYATFRDSADDLSTFVPDFSNGALSGVTAAAIVPSPAASVRRVVDHITIYNRDTANVELTITLDRNGAATVIRRVTVSPNETLEYNDATGWRVLNDAGAVKVITLSGICDENLSGALDFPLQADPDAPASGHLKMYATKIGGRMMPAVIGPSGRDTSLQCHIGGNKCAIWMPPGGATTVPGVFGMSALTASGTATSRTVAVTNILTRMSRLGYVSAATAGALSGAREAVAKYTIGAGTGLGGFFARIRFGTSDAAYVAGARMFLGFSATTTAPTNVEPGTVANTFGLAQISTSDNLCIVARDASSSITPIDLGSDFPANNNSIAYELALFSPPGGGVYWQVSRLNHAAEASGYLSSNLPASSTLLCLQTWRGNNATALAVGLDLCGIYIETDY